MSSTRFPNKIYQNINGAPLLFHTIARAKEARLIDDVIVVSPHQLPEVPEGIQEAVCSDVPENDVLSRFFQCFMDNPCDYVVRLTSDCPLLDPNLIDFVIHHSIGSDYGSNVLKLTFPDGVDAEVISKKALLFLHSTVQSPYHREHVTSIFRDNKDLQEEIPMVSIESMNNYSHIKTSIDTPDDLQRIRRMEKELFK